MKKQALTLAIAAALSAPSALAAQDTSGMRYTSAAEGFYASIRVGYESGAKENHKGTLGGGPNDDGFASRIGVRGTNDLGNGLEGFYQWEAGVRTEASWFADVIRTRVARVGLRGSFGQVQMGSFWTQDYNWTHGSTDVANVASGNLSYTREREGRVSSSLEYTTPDLNGFQGAARVVMKRGDDKTLDAWNLAGTYSVQGFTVAGAYNVRPDAIPATTLMDGGLGPDGRNGTGDDTDLTAGEEDAKSWTVRLGYKQDNWYVNGWYGQNTGAGSGSVDGFYANSNDVRATTGPSGSTSADSRSGVIHEEDETIMSLAGGISLDKVSLYALWEQRDNSHGVDGMKDSASTVGVQYNLGSNSRVWIEYAMRDLDSDEYGDVAASTTKNSNRSDDSFNIGMQHDF